MNTRVVVVGASMGGLRAAEAVVKAGFTGEVLVVGDEPHMPYNRPPLSKEALGSTVREGLEHATVAFRIPRHASEVTWRLGEPVTGADLGAQTVTLDGGETLAWDGLVVATGLRPRRLSLPGPESGRYVIRTLEDTRLLRTALNAGAPRVVVVGAGFIGCEVAATARGLGASVDVIAPEAVPMERPLGVVLGAALQARHEQHGVRFHLGRMPAAFEGDDHITAAVLDDGTRLEADVVVEAVGCAPNTDWLAGTRLDLVDGVLCDNRLRAVDVDGLVHPEVVACGDVVRFPNLLFDEMPRRVEHWTMVTDTGKQAGRSLASYLTGREEPDDGFAPMPSFWSDQYDMRLQSFGAPGLGSDNIRVLEGDLAGDVVVGYHRDGRLVGVVLVGSGGRLKYYRDQVALLHNTVPA